MRQEDAARAWEPAYGGNRLLDPDTEDMRSVKAGQLDRFTGLVSRHQSSLFRYASSLFGSRDMAEDAVQETFLAIFRGRETFDPSRGFRSWLWSIHLHVCQRASEQRSRWRRNVSLRAMGGDESSPSDDAPETSLEQAESRALLTDYLERLPMEQAEALRLRYFGELTFDEMAEATKSNPATMKSRVRYGLTKLNEWLKTRQEALQ